MGAGGACLPVATVLAGGNAAPSSHLVFDDSFAGDIIINEVRVPEGGEAPNTYYEALGWGGRAAGYGGIQVHPRGHNYIFSIWDHKEHSAPIRPVHRGPGTETTKFGGEGTGLKSWNFELGWDVDVWYTLVARCWPVDGHTCFGYWARAGDTRKWTHLVTMDVAVREALFRGRTDAFIEDWLETGERARTTNLRGGWKRRPDGEWQPFREGRYSVNAWDLEPGKRSFNFRTAWNAGVARDETGPFYFMTAGGRDTKPALDNPSRLAIERDEEEPSYAPIRIQSVKAELREDRKLAVRWQNDATTLPQFAFKVAVYDNRSAEGEPVAGVEQVVPHAREAVVALPEGAATGRLFVRLRCRDLLDHETSKTCLPAR